MVGTSFLLLGSALLTTVVSQRVSYEGSKVVRCKASTREKLDILHNLESDNELGLDFWLEARNVNRPVDIMVSNKNSGALDNMLKSAGIDCATMVQDVDAAISAERLARSQKVEASSFFSDYHDWQTVQSYIESLVLLLFCDGHYIFVNKIYISFLDLRPPNFQLLQKLLQLARHTLENL